MMNNLDELYQKYNFKTRTDIQLSSILEIERLIKFEIPEDYKSFILKHQGFEELINKEYVVLWTLEDLITLNNEYQIIQNLPNTLAIGSNGSSEFIAIEKIASKEYRVVLSPFIDLDSTYHIEIGKSFSDFLIRLDKGKEWFEIE